MSLRDPTSAPAAAAFLQREGAAAAALRAIDWAAHPLGAPETWPVALKVALGLVLASPESMFLTWGEPLYFFHNDAYAPILGPRVSWAAGAPMPRVWADVWPQVAPLVDKALSGEASLFKDLPLTMAHHGQEERTWFSFSFSPLLDETGAAVGLLCVVNETTRRVLGEAARNAQETRNRQILDSAVDYAIFATDLSGAVTRWNEGARRILGWSEEEMLGESAARIFTPEDRASDRLEQERRAALNKGSGVDERWHVRKSGERFWAQGELTPLRDAQGATIGFVKVLCDRTERRLAEEALSRSRERLDAALDDLRRANARLESNVAARTAERDRLWDASPDLLVILDFEGRFLLVNPAWTDILGYAPDDLVGAQVESLVHPDDVAQTREAVKDAGGGPLPIFENRYRHKDGSYRWISWVAAPTDAVIYATGRHVTAAKAAAEALRRAEEQLRQSQKVEAVGQLTGGVAHDFNNLLTVILGSVDLLRRPNLSEERRRRYIDAIGDTAERAARLTSQLLAFARRQALRPEIFDVGASLGEVVEMVGGLMGPRIKMSVSLPNEPCFVNADRSQFDTAIVNMAVNARDAMQGGGELSVSVAPVSQTPAVRTHSAVEGDFVAITVADTGEGVPADQIESIFEPFFTTKKMGEGTGLGLSQVFGFAKQSGGEIMVASVEGEGAAFTLYLPREIAPGAGGESRAQATPATLGRGACVLVVEDNPDVGVFALQALEELGYETVLASDGAQALAELATARARIDLVFSDVVMPGMSGIELGEAIRKLYPDLPIVLTSGYSAVLAQTGSHGFELLQKPYTIDALARALQSAAAPPAPTK